MKRTIIFLLILTQWLANACTSPATQQTDERAAEVRASYDIALRYTPHEGLTRFVTHQGKYGYMDDRGRVVIAPRYDRAHDFNEGVALVATANKEGLLGYGLITPDGETQTVIRQGNLLLAPQVENGMLGYTDLQTGRRGYIDREGVAVVRPDEEKRQANQSAETRQKPAQAGKVKEMAQDVQTPMQKMINADEWKQISSKNPFFAEAEKVVMGKLEENDAKNRRMILNYVEHLRTSYTTKDIDFLRQLFSENALIIVGTVVKTAPQMEQGYLRPQQVIYNVKSKRQYLERLARVFVANKRIDVKFSNFRIMRHPTLPGIYGVSLRQGYTSDLYSDDGYLFLLWDFRDRTAPKIHVRTWQPRMTDSHTPLPEDAIFSIENFNLQ